MKVALVQCPLWSVTQPPPGLAYVSAALRARGFHVEVHHLELELFREADPALRPRFAPDTRFEELAAALGIERRLDGWAERIVASGAQVAGFSIFYTTVELSLALARRIKALAPHVRVIFGGPSCDRRVHGLQLIRDPVVDAVVTGEGEETAPELLAGLDQATGLFRPTAGALVKDAQGTVVDGEDRPMLRDLDAIPFPDFSDFDLAAYARPNSLPLLTSRGCPNRCKFCSERGFWRKYRTRSAESVFAEISRHVRELGVTRFYWVDSLINGNMRELDRLLDLILKDGMRIRWYGMASIRREMTAEFLDKMARAGCVLLQYGIESGSARVRGEMGKSPDVGLVERVLRDTKRAGIKVHGLFIVGYPTETTLDFLRTLAFIRRNRRCFDYLVRPTCPYVCLPGSILYDEREAWGIQVEEGRYAEWTSQNGRNTFARRRRRLAAYHWFVRRLGIPQEIGPELFEDGANEPALPTAAACIVPESSRRVRFLSIEGPAHLARGGRAAYTVRLANAGNSTLCDWARAGEHPVGLGYHWLDGEGGMLVFDDGVREYLREPLAPGAETTVRIEVAAPRKGRADLLRFAVVQDGVAWFEAVPPEAAEIAVRVT